MNNIDDITNSSPGTDQIFSGSFDVKEFVECGAVRNVEMTYEVTEFMLKLVMTSGSEFQNLLNTNRTYDITIIEPNFAEAQIYLSHRWEILPSKKLVNGN